MAVGLGKRDVDSEGSFTVGGRSATGTPPCPIFHRAALKVYIDYFAGQIPIFC